MAEGILDTSTLILLRRIDEMTDTLPSEPLITAIAVSRGLPVHSCNPADFDKIDDLKIFAVPHPGPGSTTRSGSVVTTSGASLSAPSTSTTLVKFIRPEKETDPLRK